MHSTKQYNATADILRIIAILAVIVIHTTTKTFEASAFAIQKIPFTVFLNQIFRLAVPLFFIISGFVLELNYHLHKHYFMYLKKRLSRILIPYIFWSAVYYFFVFSNHPTFQFFRSLLVGDASYQLYFIPALLIFYIIFPLIHKYFKIIANPLVLISLFIIELGLLYIDYDINNVSFFLPLKIVLLNYFAFILGVFLSKNHESCIKMLNKLKIYFGFGALIFGSIIFHEGTTGYITTHNYLMLYSQWRPSVLLYTIFLGGILYWIFDRNMINVSLVKKLAKLSFFVFFIHVIMIELLWNVVGAKIFELEFAQNLWWDPLYFFTVALLSFFIAYLVHKIPHLSKITG